jgi:hypothetical protein
MSLKYWCPGSFGERSTGTPADQVRPSLVDFATYTSERPTVPGVAEEYDDVLATTVAGSTAFQVAKTPGRRPVWSAVSRGSSGTR